MLTGKLERLEEVMERFNASLNDIEERKLALQRSPRTAQQLPMLVTSPNARASQSRTRPMSATTNMSLRSKDGL
jgi:hypothetical protein